MQTSNIYKINTNIKDSKGTYVSFYVQANNPKNAIYVANECNYNGKTIEDENIQSVTLSQENVVASYFNNDVENNDLNSNYIIPTTDEENN